MKITPTTLTITQLLSNEQEQFVVPAYQRRYSWQTKQIKELFDDIQHLDQNESHLLGSIVCLTSSHGAGLNELELVDGQQRTTTIMLFLNAMEERFKLLKRTDDEKKVREYLYAKNYNDEISNKLQLGDLDNKDFSLIMKNEDLENVINKRLLEAHNLTMQLIGDLSEEELGIFKKKFVNQATVIRLDVSESKDAFKLFETINNRGLSLSPSDIIKNFLLGNASLISNGTLEKVKEDWTKVVVSLDGLPDRITMDDFFRQYVIQLRGSKVTGSNLIDSFKKYYAKNVTEGELLHTYTEYEDDTETEVDQKISIVDFARDISQAAYNYGKIIRCDTDNPKINRRLKNLQLIRSFVSYSFVLNLVMRNIDKSDLEQILHMLEVFMLRRNVAEYRTNELEDIFARLIKLPIEGIVEGVSEEFRASLPSDEEFYNGLVRQDFKGQMENRAKYILEYLEYQSLAGKRETYISGPEDVHLEHIMPQTISTKRSKEEEGGDWIAYLGEAQAEIHSNYVAKLGNLTLLGAPLNIRASNNPFKAKKSGEANDTTSKESNYALSEIQITRDLLNEDEWKIPQIQRRTIKLAVEAVEIWKI